MSNEQPKRIIKIQNKGNIENHRGQWKSWIEEMVLIELATEMGWMDFVRERRNYNDNNGQ